MKFFSYNVNGLRAAINKGFISWLEQEQPDVIGLQEIKVRPEQLDTEFLDRLGYHHYWFPAEKKGYSGVAVFTKVKPDFIGLGMGLSDYDSEGRLIRLDFGEITCLNVYFPSGTSGDIRQGFKMKFLDDFDLYIQALRKERPDLIIFGDFNIAHHPIDINFPKKHITSSGFLPEERAWMDRFMAKGFIDSFRVFSQEPDQYSWWTFRAQARAKNLGWRIDYHWVSETLRPRLKNASIHSEVVHSDHCPVSVELDLSKR